MTGAHPTFKGIVRKLHQWELDHLRELVVQQQAQLDEQQQRIGQLTRERNDAEDCAENWRENAMRVIEDAGSTVGLTIDGHIVAVLAP